MSLVLGKKSEVTNKITAGHCWDSLRVPPKKPKKRRRHDFRKRRASQSFLAVKRCKKQTFKNWTSLENQMFLKNLNMNITEKHFGV
jgi:hypothetical protein